MEQKQCNKINKSWASLAIFESPIAYLATLRIRQKIFVPNMACSFDIYVIVFTKT